MNEAYKSLGPSRKFTTRKMKVTIPWTSQRVEHFGLPDLDLATAVRVRRTRQQRQPPATPSVQYRTQLPRSPPLTTITFPTLLPPPALTPTTSSLMMPWVPSE